MRFQAFVSTTSGAETVNTFNTQDLINSIGVTALTTHSYSSIAQSARVVSIEAWTMSGLTSGAPSAIAPTSVGLVWFDSGNRSKTNLVSDTSLSSAAPAHLKTKPPLNSSPGFWFNSGLTVNLFDIIVTGYSSGYTFLVVDVVLDFTMSNQTYSSNTVTGLTGTLVVGNTYYPPLDGNNGIFNRQGLPNANS